MQRDAARLGLARRNTSAAASVAVCVSTFSNRLKTNSFKLVLDECCFVFLCLQLAGLFFFKCLLHQFFVCVLLEIT